MLRYRRKHPTAASTLFRNRAQSQTWRFKSLKFIVRMCCLTKQSLCFQQIKVNLHKNLGVLRANYWECVSSQVLIRYKPGITMRRYSGIREPPISTSASCIRGQVMIHSWVNQLYLWRCFLRIGHWVTGVKLCHDSKGREKSKVKALPRSKRTSSTFKHRLIEEHIVIYIYSISETIWQKKNKKLNELDKKQRLAASQSHLSF